MAPFQDGQVLAGAFGDFDALAMAVADWDLRFSQFGTGRFSGDLRAASTAQIQLVRERWSTSLLAEGAQPAGVVSLCLTMAAPAGMRWLGLQVDHARTIVGGMPRHEVQYLGLGMVDLMAVSIDRALFDSHVHARFQVDPEAIGRDIQLKLLPEAPGAPERGRAADAIRAALAAGAATSSQARHRLEEAVLHVLLDGIDLGDASASIPGVVRQRALRRAQEVLRARIDDPPSLGELCALTGASERTLHAAFQDGLAMPPKRYLRALRLNAARRSLRRREGSVTQVAAALGFFHFARFASEYRNLFGELPSETLREARSATRPGIPAAASAPPRAAGTTGMAAASCEG